MKPNQNFKDYWDEADELCDTEIIMELEIRYVKDALMKLKTLPHGKLQTSSEIINRN
jgi:hypothetical protein